MANYNIPQNPTYTETIRKLENEDPASAEDIFNPLIQTLIDNTHAVKKEADGKAAANHTHQAGDIGGGVLPISKGGTGQTTAAAARNALGLGNTTGALPIANGGTGNTTGNAASATKLATARTIQVNLGSTSAVNFDGTANISPGVTGTLPVARGGTGQTTAAGIRNTLGLGNTTGALPIANGGTGQTTAAAARDALGAAAASGDTITVLNDTAYTTSKVRNISFSTADLTAGSSALTSGTIRLIYE